MQTDNTDFEYFSEDPYLAGKLATAYIKGLQGKGVAACIKHFACNNQETRRLSGSSQVDERTLREIYLPAFEIAVKEGKVRSVMNAYNAVNGTFCAENKELLTDILRDEWGYQGFVVTDWGAVKDRVKGLLAGVDLEMPGSTQGKTAKIMKAVEDGALSMEKLDEAVRNVLLFVKEAVENQKTDANFDREAAHVKSGEFARECAVLLKNEGVLPLDRTQKIAVIGAFAKTPHYQGAGSSRINVKHIATALECMDGWTVSYAKGYDPDSGKTDEALIKEAAEAAKDADAAVIFAGLPDSYEIEGCDRETMKMTENQNALIAAVAAVQPECAVVLHSGSSIELPWVDSVKAILCMYLGGDQVGRAAVELLCGQANPSGRLAKTWPVQLEDNPSYFNFPGEDGIVEYNEGIFIGYRYYDKKKMQVNFPFGHGLSYTDFAYSDLQIDRQEMTERDRLTVRCRIRNTGTVSGKEVVQLYVSMPVSKVRRAVRELKGFRKIALQPGEEKEVVFELDFRSFAYYETRIHDWFVESGEIEIAVGASSRDLRLNGKVVMKSSMTLPIHYTRYSTIGEMMLSPKGMEYFVGMFGGAKSEEEKQQEEEADNAMGAGAERMKQQMMMEMPLNALVSYGRISDEQLEDMIAGLNQ
ncbi:MAG: glycoside hydrolase family 3 C-terminal domain-containing protein [Lachnospiraceae bacterium]|nr:glycoside hydrolase family 3 C-terminal domain-containing protein [Lachnospiraceae bacterium]